MNAIKLPWCQSMQCCLKHASSLLRLRCLSAWILLHFGDLDQNLLRLRLPIIGNCLIEKNKSLTVGCPLPFAFHYSPVSWMVFYEHCSLSFIRVHQTRFMEFCWCGLYKESSRVLVGMYLDQMNFHFWYWYMYHFFRYSQLSSTNLIHLLFANMAIGTSGSDTQLLVSVLERLVVSFNELVLCFLEYGAILYELSSRIDVTIWQAASLPSCN